MKYWIEFITICIVAVVGMYLVKKDLDKDDGHHYY